LGKRGPLIDDPLSGYGREGAQGGKTKPKKSESESIFSVEPVGVRYKVDSATSQMTKEIAYAKKPPVAPPRAKVPPVIGKSPLKYPAPSSIPPSESSTKPEPTQEETAPPSPPNVPSPAYPQPTSSEGPSGPEGGPSPTGPSKVAPPASTEGKGPGPSQTISVLIPPMPSKGEEKYGSGNAPGGSGTEAGGPAGMGSGTKEEGGPEGSPESGSAPAYPKPTSVIHSPSSSHADRVASEISTTPQPQGVYQHPRGKEIPTAASTTTSAPPQPSSEESSLTPPPTYPAESVKSVEASTPPNAPEEHPESVGPEETGLGAPEITGSGEMPGGPTAVVESHEGEVGGDGKGAEAEAKSGEAPSGAEYAKGTPEAEGGVEPKGPSESEGGKTKGAEDSGAKPIGGGEQYKKEPETTATEEKATTGGDGGASSKTEPSGYETDKKKGEEKKGEAPQYASGKEEGEDETAPENVPGPLVKIDSTSKDKNIVIAYTPNKPMKQPKLNKNGLFCFVVLVKRRQQCV
ncbi:hypothetical protein ANCDUO_16689, partial [Ancylostoma duodenale]